MKIDSIIKALREIEKEKIDTEVCFLTIGCVRFSWSFLVSFCFEKVKVWGDRKCYSFDTQKSPKPTLRTRAQNWCLLAPTSTLQTLGEGKF